jgi:hypothetical protein
MLLQIKKIVIQLIHLVSIKVNWFKYLILIKQTSSNTELYIFDLDNTLADTFPYLSNTKMKKVYANIPVLIGMVKIFKKCIESDKKVIIISARPFIYYYVTKVWVKKNISFNKNIPIFIVQHPTDKIPYIIYASKKLSKVTYYDDLSYNQENGEVKFYTDVIKTIKSLPINYIGYNEINSINNITLL